MASWNSSCVFLSFTCHNSSFVCQSALQVSVVANQHLITQDLLFLGAQVNTLDVWGRSPLHVCADKGHIHTLKVRTSLEHQQETWKTIENPQIVSKVYVFEFHSVFLRFMSPS